LIGGSVGPLLYSKWASVGEKQLYEEMQQVSRFFWLFIIPAIMLIYVCAGFIIPFIYGSAYTPSVNILKILLIGIGARFILIPMNQMFAVTGKAILTSIVFLCSIISMVVCVVILVPVYGAIGGAIAFAISNCIALFIGYCFCMRKFGIHVNRCFIINKCDLNYLNSILNQLFFTKIRRRGK